MHGVYTWGRCHPADLLRVINRSPVVQDRPALGIGEWALVDRAIVEAINLLAPALDVVVAIAAADADSLARDIYVFYEPMVSIAIAVGHVDHSVSWHLTENLVDSNEDVLRSILDDANRELARGALADALATIASNIRRLRPVGGHRPTGQDIADN